MAEWQRIAERRAPYDFQSLDVIGGVLVVTPLTVRDVLEDPVRLTELMKTGIAGAGKGRVGDARFTVFKKI